MEKPMQMLLEHKEIDINFCFHWATDDWSMSWYGGKDKVVLKQEIPEADAYWRDISPFFHDKRYITINGKPLLVIYKCHAFKREEFVLFLKQLRKKAVDSGFPGLYIMISTWNGLFNDAELWGGDALVEYQPWRICVASINNQRIFDGYMNPNFKGQVIDIGDAIQKKKYLLPCSESNYFRSAMVSWDNSARKKEVYAIILWGNSPSVMKGWLVDLILESKRIHTKEENFVFLSSWNEWAEGSHLEPDWRYGYAWLDAVKEAHKAARK